MHALFTCRGTLNNGRRCDLEKICLIKLFFLFSLCTHIFRKIAAETHTDRFNDVLATFLGLGTFPLRYCLWRVRELSYLNKNILICVSKMNEGLTGLERNEGESNFHFWVNYPVNLACI